jgi:hypothetical protein
MLLLLLLLLLWLRQLAAKLLVDGGAEAVLRLAPRMFPDSRQLLLSGFLPGTRLRGKKKKYG